MADFKVLEVVNSKATAVRTGKWKNPEAALYNQLLNAIHCKGKVPADKDELDEKIKNGNYRQWDFLLKEAYLIAPVKEINNSPHGVTPFSRSGCKYPHHVIKGNKLVISVPGLRSAFITARNQGVFMKHTQENKQIVAHLNRHCKELGLKPVWHHGNFYLMEEHEVKIEKNFNDIYLYLQERTGINLFDNPLPDLLSGNQFEENSLFQESVIEGSADHPVLTHDFDKEVGAKTPQALWEWMHNNIQYDHDTDNWELRTAAQLYMDKKGICHDQSYFESLILHSWGYDNWQLYFVEFKDDSDQGGNSHTLTYYLDGGKYYWFENAWEDQAGIHGPYESKEDIKQAVMDAYNSDDDINSHEYDGIVFGEHPNYRLGMNLWDYCNSWDLNDDRHFDKNRKDDSIAEATEWIERFVNDDVFREAAEITTLSELVKTCKTPNDLMKWMRCIQYAFLDKNGKVIDSDNTNDLYDRYRYQSPQQLIRRKKGVCWDCTGLARQWFERSRYPFCEVYLEIVDDEDCPSHTLIIFKDPGESQQVSWFESSWDAKKGIHPYGDLKTCMDSVVDEFLKSHDADPKTTKLICTSINKGIKYGCTMQEFMDFAHASQQIDLGDLFYDEVFGEAVSEEPIDGNMPVQLIEEKYRQAEVPPNHVGFTMETLPRIMFFASRNRHPTVQNDRVFLTPYVGIASLFIVDTTKAIAEEFKKQTGRLPKRTSFNTSFREWEMEGPDLTQPLKKIHINHNIGALEGTTIKGTAKGYIHCIDITDIRDQLKLFSSKDPDREVYYDGGKPLKPVEIIEHKLKWEMVYSPENAKHHGQGIVERTSIIPNVNDLQWMNERANSTPFTTDIDEHILMEDGSDKSMEIEDPDPTKANSESYPKKVDRAESSKNGVRRKKLYLAFIQWAKEHNKHNSFGSIFDKDAFKVSYPFVPEEMRYFYRIANPMICVLTGHLTFFPVTQLRKVNSENPDFDKKLIFAATENDLRIFNKGDKKIYKGTESDEGLILSEEIGETFDLYIQDLIGKGDILNGPTEDEDPEEITGI